MNLFLVVVHSATPAKLVFVYCMPKESFEPARAKFVKQNIKFPERQSDLPF